MADNRAKMAHLLDQIGAEMEGVLRDMAPLVSRYHTQLMDEGTHPHTAIQLALDAQRQLIADYIIACREDDADGR